MRAYQELLEELEDNIEITMLYLAYEIKCRFEFEADDELLEKLYQAYINDNWYDDIIEFVEEIQEWCEDNSTEFKDADYDLMLKEI